MMVHWQITQNLPLSIFQSSEFKKWFGYILGEDFQLPTRREVDAYIDRFSVEMKKEVIKVFNI